MMTESICRREEKLEERKEKKIRYTLFYVPIGARAVIDYLI